ncbi:hypothetical protein L484_020721 [Morus notabilis]|uniref:Disease resistance R13L4/SHOC-2-like LRR domain-containing protein n=1 Tax=Morus notabilis TaxID=981085 RepID=W9R8G0_9ROSA|nr:hypothetical protein L484_020721 [Morus notabilis]
MYDREIESSRCISRLRSFFVFSNRFGSPSSLFSMPSGFKLGSWNWNMFPIYNLSSEVGNLFNLRHLNLKGTEIRKLPKSIGKTSQLTNPEPLPNLSEETSERNHESTKLKLQVLSSVKVNDNAMRCVKNLTQLTCLGIEKTKEVDERAWCSSIEKLQHLCHLGIKASSDEEVLRLEALSLPPPQLRRLHLIGKLDKVPHWFRSLNNLRALYLSWSRLAENPLFYIRSLPNLQRLTLVNAYTGDCFYIPKGFLTLKSLILHNFPSLNEMVIEKRGTQGILNLWLFNCMALKTLPHGIEHLTNLQQINLKNVVGIRAP